MKRSGRAVAHLLTDEPVSHTGLGDEIPRTGWVGLELTAESRHLRAEGPGTVRRRPASLVERPLCGDEASSVAHQERNDLPGGSRESHRPAGGLDPLGCGIDREIGRANGDDALGRVA